MPELHPERKIYLDLDGVIFPFWHNLDHVTEMDRPRLKEHGDLETKWVNRIEFYYPAIARRLGQMAARGVIIMPSSSRSSDLFVDYPSVAEDLGGIDRCLIIDKFRPGSIDLKAEAVFNNFQGIIDRSDEHRGWERSRSIIATPPAVNSIRSRAVWIDDHASIDRLEDSDSDQSREILNEPSLKIICPNSSIGLTMTHLDTAEAFLFQ